MYSEPFCPFLGDKDVLYANFIAQELKCTKPCAFTPMPPATSEAILQQRVTLHESHGPLLMTYLQTRFEPQVSGVVNDRITSGKKIAELMPS